MKEKKQHVINQHYVPECILKYFKESDEIHNRKKRLIFHVLHEKGIVYPSTTTRIMSGEYIYEHPDFARNEIEGQLKRFEAWYSELHGQFVSLISEYEAGRAKFSEVKTYAYKIVEPMIRMHLRSGAMMYELKFWQERRRSLDSLYGMLARLQNRNYTNAFASTLINFHEFCILKSFNKNFVISDQFLVSAALSFKARFGNATNRMIGQKDVLILLPVSKSHYLCFYNGSKPNFVRTNQLRYLSQDQTDKINQVIMNNSYVQTAGPCNDSLGRILKYYKQIWPTAIYYGGNNIKHGAELRKEVFFFEKDELIFDFVQSPHEWSRYDGVQKDDLCPCGSKVVYGNCCRYKQRAFERFMRIVEAQDKNPNYDPHSIAGCRFHELNIFEY